jgi:archaellum component FlaC
VQALAEAQQQTAAQVQALAEAQQRTEERLERLEAQVQALTEAQRQTAAQVQALAEAQQRTAERLERLEAQVQALAEAQRQTAAQVQALAEAQQRTEERLERLETQVQALAEAQQQTAAQVQALAEAQQQTAAQVQALAEAQQQTAKELRNLRGRFDGRRLEEFCREHPWLFSRLVRRPVVLTPNELAEMVADAVDAGRITEVEAYELGMVDLIVRGFHRRESSPLYLAVEISVRIDTDDVERAVRRQALLTQAGYQALPVAVGESVHELAETLAGDWGVALVYVAR